MDDKEVHEQDALLDYIGDLYPDSLLADGLTMLSLALLVAAIQEGWSTLSKRC